MNDPIQIARLLPPINRKLQNDFGYTINLDGLDEYRNILSDLLDLDLEALLNAAKETMIWRSYLVDATGLLDIAIGKYQNVLDIYEYLDSVSIKDPDEFALAAPKYKIDSRNLPVAIKEVQAKKEEVVRFVKAIKMLRSDLDSVANYMLAMHYRCSALIISSDRRMSNAAL